MMKTGKAAMPETETRAVVSRIAIGDYAAGADFPMRAQPHGKFFFAWSGLMEVSVGGVWSVAPPQSAVWLPPMVAHGCRTASGGRFSTIHLDRQASRRLPAHPCCLAVPQLLRAITLDFAERGIEQPATAEDRRLARVVLDLLSRSPERQGYLTLTADPLLRGIVDRLQQDPGDRRSMAEWARVLAVSERTLARHWQETMAVPFGEWRERLRTTAAIALLDEGMSVRELAGRLGYANASSFIAMFRRQTGRTPATFHRPMPANRAPHRRSAAARG